MMMRKNNNNNRNKHRGGQGGGRRYNGGGGNGGGSSRPNDGANIQRQKHHATQQLGKYSDMARNAQINGDRVDVEYYLQHVDHYTRVLTDIAAIEAERFAHQREHQPAQSSQDAAPQEAPNGETGESTSEGGEAQASSEGGEQSQAPRQPRRERGPRRERSDNGAAEANSNTNEIPLPGSILPPV